LDVIIERLRDQIDSNLLARIAAGERLTTAEWRQAVMQLQANLVSIASYVPSMIVRDQFANPQPGRISGAYWEGSVLFADLSGFTALSGQLSTLGKQGAEEISAIINHLFSTLVAEVQRYHGSLLKFGGDALTVFFDAETLGPNHATYACRAALAMQERMAEFVNLETRAGSFTLRLRIGVHAGRVFAAQVGSFEHIELVVTGHDINRVAQAQEIAEPGEVVVTTDTAQRLDNPQIELRPAGFVCLTALDAAPPPPSALLMLPDGNGDLAELLALADRIAALRPYLPRHLPRRFLDSDASGVIGEFRPVTVLFANFLDFSTILASLPDQHDLAAQILNAYYQQAQAVIHHYGGIVNKVDMYTHGDKLMALFGAPLANEDDPIRAVRAALALHTVLDSANQEIARLCADHGLPAFRFQHKIGINTGVVFAGKVGSTTRHEYTVMGQPVNISARLMSIAPANEILLSPSTRRAVERSFEIRNLPPVRLKGVSSPVPIAAVLMSRDVRSDQLDQALLVGRSQELEYLLHKAQTALHGQGQVVALVGDAGSGKTRLIAETLQQTLERSIQPHGTMPICFPYIVECQSYEQNTPYATIRELLRQLFSLTLLQTSAEAVNEVQRRVYELCPDLERFTALLGDVLNVPLAETALTLALSPQQRHDRVQELIEALVLAESRLQPLVVIVDDLHWCDASSLELLTRLTRRIADASVLFLLGYRTNPSVTEAWLDLPHAERMVIGELAPEARSALVRELLGGEPPPGLRTLLEPAQGNPFFLEEVIRGLKESSILTRVEQRWQLSQTVDTIDVPNSIEGVITARLDRLEERSRDVLQVASVVGRRFPYPVLSGVVNRYDDLPQHLSRLTSADLIEPEERNLAYLFRHVLTRDVAYESILYVRRRELHRRVAQQIEAQNADRIDEQAALLARHYLLAEEWEPALEYHLRAGRIAHEQFANREAITLFQRALEIARRSDVHNAAQKLVSIYEHLGMIHALLGEYDTALPAYESALEIVHTLPDVPIDDQVRLHHHIARVYEKRAAFDAAFEWVEKALTLARVEQSAEVARCLLLGAGLHRRKGRYQEAIEWGEKALTAAQYWESQRDQGHAAMLLGGTYRSLGDNLKALELGEECVALYSDAGDMVGLADAYNDLANTCYELGRLDDARRNYEAGATIKQAIGDVYGQAMIANNLGDLLKLQGEIDAAIRQFDKSLGMFEKLGSTYAVGVLHMNIGAAYLLNIDLAQAERHLSSAADLFVQVGAEDFLPELKRNIAELHVQRGELGAARFACEQSLQHAVQLEARAEEGMTRRVLGRVFGADGDLVSAWQELNQSLAILREAGSPHEIARTLLAIARLAQNSAQVTVGSAALAEALPLLRQVGARRDLHEAETLLQQYQAS
jgi:class 3 adenylate cyclase/predicted ATPase